MANSLLSWNNLVDGASVSLSASSYAGGLAPVNVADPIVGKRCRLTSASEWVQADFSTDVTIECLAVVFSRDTTFPTSGTVRHQLDADGGTPGSGVAHDSTAISVGAVDGYGYHLYVPSAAVTARYWRATFSGSGLSFIDIGRLWAGDEAFRPGINIAGGYDEAWGDLSQISVAERTGAEYVDSRARQRSFAFGLNALSQAERDTLREMGRIAGSSGQVLFCLDTANFDKETVLGRMAITQSIRHVALSNQLYQKAFAIRESL